MRSRLLVSGVRSRVLGWRVRSRLNPSHVTKQHNCRGVWHLPIKPIG
ncbi:MAG: hypothetical protein RIG63_01845 [Coleofasciculus chthonoplastes F3-SA18-01]